ncbi:MAG: alpha/beta fold hydrolase [Polyangiaceae bacterium]
MIHERLPLIFTVLSKRGPIEEALVHNLAPYGIAEKHRIGSSVVLRSLERAPATENAATLVFLHGRGHSAAIWSPLLRTLPHDVGVIAIDLPGFGHSGEAGLEQDSAQHGLEYFRDPIEDTLKKTPNLVLVGHSLGGLVALDLALRRFVDARALVLVDAMGLSPQVTPLARAYLHFGPEIMTTWIGPTLRGTSLTGDDRRDLEALRAELRSTRGTRPGARRAFKSLVPIMGDAFSMRSLLPQLAVPTLLVWGERDRAFPLPIAVDASTRIKNVRLETLPTDHSPHTEEAERTGALISDFLASSGVAY